MVATLRSDDNFTPSLLLLRLLVCSALALPPALGLEDGSSTLTFKRGKQPLSNVSKLQSKMNMEFFANHLHLR
eukprot:COSAG04_NODE_8340_length_988_cov_0.932508_1_plen_72_part_10